MLGLDLEKHGERAYATGLALERSTTPVIPTRTMSATRRDDGTRQQDYRTSITSVKSTQVDSTTSGKRSQIGNRSMRVKYEGVDDITMKHLMGSSYDHNTAS